MARRTPRFLTVATAALAATVLAGCGTATSGVTAAGEDDRVNESAAPSPSQSERADAQPTRSTATRATLTGRLLSAEELPGFNGRFRWTEERTTRREPKALAGTCHRFEMLSIGAMRVAYRSYLPASGGDARADQLVASFADPKTAWRAFEVLKSWAADCDQALSSYDTHEVGALTNVPVHVRAGHWYLLTYGPAAGDPDARYFDAQGLALSGNRVTVLRMRLTGQDYDYRVGKEPMVTAVHRASAKLL